MSESNRGYNELYPKILAVYKQAKGAKYCQQLAKSKWQELKQYKQTPDQFREKYDEYDKSLQNTIEKMQKKQNNNKKMTTFFKVVKRKRDHSEISSSPQNVSSNDKNVSVRSKYIPNLNGHFSLSTPLKKVKLSTTPTSKYATPAQDKISYRIKSEKISLKALEEQAQLISDEKDAATAQVNIISQRTKIKKLEKDLDRKQRQAGYSKKCRDKKTKILKNFSATTGDRTVGRLGPGRPPLEDLKMNEGLLDFYKVLAAEKIAGSVNERRRDEIITSTKTLDQLLKIAHEADFEFSRTAFYLRFQPARRNTRQGQLHRPKFDVKFAKPQNKARKRHEGKFIYVSSNDENVSMTSEYVPHRFSSLFCNQESSQTIGELLWTTTM